jgi:hypothetical protein
MEMQTATDTGKARAPRGRKDRDKQEAVIEAAVVHEKILYLENLCRASISAADEFNDSIKAVAEKSGLMASVVRKYVVARVSDKVEDKRRESEQLSLLFTEE